MNLDFIKIKYIVLIGSLLLSISTFAQYRKAQNLPYADQKLYHFGFTLGMHTQDMPITNTGYVQPNKQEWYAEIPSHSFGFNVGIIADRYLSQYFNLRTNPTLYFGEKRFVFKEQVTGEEYEKELKGSYFVVPVHIKVNGTRTRNFRPYLLAGPYVAFAIGNKKNEALRFKDMDYGLEFGFGCHFYFPFFKLSPEIKFSLGLNNIINTDRSDLADPELLKYSQAVSSGKNRMVSLIFNFE